MDSPYELLPEDTEYLDGNYLSRWEKISEGNGKFGLLIRGFPIPDGYTTTSSTLMILVPSGYPGSQLDMFYFDPPLSRLDGSSINALAQEVHFGQDWQRWSRHYGWEPGQHNIVTHIEYIKNEIQIQR